MFSLYLLALPTLLLSVLTQAAPQVCTPNFQGQAQTIYALPSSGSNVNEWTPDSIFPGAHFTLQSDNLNNVIALNQFLVQFTGQPDNSYNFRLQAETNRYTALTAGVNGQLTNELLNLSTSLPSQRFTISCNSCPSTPGGTTAQQCVIKNPSTGLCVVGSNPGDTLALGSCSSPGIYYFKAT